MIRDELRAIHTGLLVWRDKIDEAIAAVEFALKFEPPVLFTRHHETGFEARKED